MDHLQRRVITDLRVDETAAQASSSTADGHKRPTVQTGSHSARTVGSLPPECDL